MRIAWLIIALLVSAGSMASADQKKWKEPQLVHQPPVIAEADTVDTDIVTKPGKLDIDKLRGTAKKNVLLRGEYIVWYQTDQPRYEYVSIGDSTVAIDTGEKQVAAVYAIKVRYQGDKATITKRDGQQVEYDADKVTVHPRAFGGQQ